MNPPPFSFFDPLSLRNLADGIERTLGSQDPIRLTDTSEEIRGVGIYALYYVGDCEHYRPLAHLNRAAIALGLGPVAPIYVGKAMPEGQQNRAADLEELEVASQGRYLYARLRDHLKSIELAENLDPEHFLVRGLLLAPVWIRLGESVLIQKYKPVWNVAITGFGNHDPGGNRPQKTSDWDTLHPGRAKNWKAKLLPGRGKEAILEDLSQYWERWRASLPPRLLALLDSE